MRLAGVLPLCAVLAGAANAQGARQNEDQREQPEVRKVVTEGVHAVDAGDLKKGLATQATRCKSAILYPICLFSKGGVWNHRRYLDHVELRRDVVRVKVFYFRHGYRHTQVDTAVRYLDPKRETAEVTFRITEGRPTIVRDVQVAGLDSLIKPKALRDLVKVRSGEPLNLNALDSSVALIKTSLAVQGYADGIVRDTTIVTDSARVANAEITADPHRKATVADVEVSGNQKFGAGTINNIVTLHKGDIFRSDKLEESERNLYRSGLFRRATIRVPPTQDSAKTMSIELIEASQRLVRASAGFNTVDFVQVQGNYVDYNFLGNARRLDLLGTLGNLLAPTLNGNFIFHDVQGGSFGSVDQNGFLDPTWQAGLTLTQPYFRSPDNSIGASLFAHRSISPGVYIDRGYGASLAYTRYVRSGMPLSISYRWEQTEVQASDVYFCVNFGVCAQSTVSALRDQNTLSPLTLTFAIERANDPLMPTQGYRTRIDLQHASQFTFSDFRYNRIFAEQTNYRRMGRGTLAIHFRGGFVKAMSNPSLAFGDSVLHPRTRFFAGGANSVRGYGENQLGPRVLTIDPAYLANPALTGGNPCSNAQILAHQCPASSIAAVASDSFIPRPTGGSALLEGSVEYRMRLFGQLYGAVFLDGAFVGLGGLQTIGSGNGALTPGFGFRYASPVGPIRVDLGIRPTLREDLPVLTQVVDPGGTVHIVALTDANGHEIDKVYDPLEGQSGFHRFLARLALHLSIGEAF